MTMISPESRAAPIPLCRCLRRKRQLFQELLEDAGGSGGGAITREDFDFLLG